jgi:disulfide bond formation protein DsbB
MFYRLSYAQLLALFGGLPLLAVLIAQYGFGYAPCELCLLQRAPYVVVLLLAVMAWRAPDWQQAAGWLAAPILLTSFGLALFHSGVEQDLWQYASSCSMISGGNSLEQLRAAINAAPLVGCKQPQITLFGLSMANYNVGASLAMLGLLMLRLRRNNDD